MEKLYVTCECSRRTEVTAAKCGEVIRCLCGKSMTVPLLSVLRSTSIPDPIEPVRGPSSNEQEIDKLETRLSFFRLGSVIVLGFQLVQALRGDYGAIVFGPIFLVVLIISDRSFVNKLKKLKSQNGDLP